MWGPAGVVMALLCACSVSTPAAPSPVGVTRASPTPTSHQSPSPHAPPTSKAHDVGRLITAAGVTQWVQCAGTGPVTTLIIAGLGSSTRDWLPVLPQLQRITRTCVYDRPGLGHSPPRNDGRDPIDAGRHARELAAALNAIGEHGPYLVLGHSYGGLVARAFVAQHPPDIAGVLLAESVTPYDPTLGEVWVEATSVIDLAASSRATHGGPPLRDLPLIVLTASRPEANRLDGPDYGQPADVTDEWLRGQRANLTLSSDSIQVTAHSGHELQKDAPDAVVEAVRQLVSAIETTKPLACTPVWKELQTTCRA